MTGLPPGVAEAFADLGDTIYMNTASSAAGNRAARAAFDRAITDRGTGRFDWTAGEIAAGDARRLYAELVGVPDSRVALIPSVAAVAGLVANHLARNRSGGNIVVGESEFTSNLFAWRLLENEGYEVRLVPFVDGRVPVDSFAARTDRDTRLIAVSSVQSSSGYRADLAAMRELADGSGALLFVDASQSVGALPLDVTGLGIDAVAACAHKFLLGTRGMGYACFAEELIDTMTPLSAGWAASAEPMSAFYGPDMTLSDTASRFDMSIAWFNALADRDSLRLLHDIGFEVVHRHNQCLAEHIQGALTDAGIPFLDHGTEHRSTVFSLAPDVDDLPGRMEAIDLVASERAGRIRLSLHIYNTTDQIDTVVDVLS